MHELRRMQKQYRTHIRSKQINPSADAQRDLLILKYPQTLHQTHRARHGQSQTLFYHSF